MTRNIIDLCLVAAAYLFLYALLPFWLRGFRLSGENAMSNLMSSYIIGNVIIISCVYTLSLIGIYNTFTIILLLAGIATFYRMKFKRSGTVGAVKSFERHFLNFKDGYYHPKVLLRDGASKLKHFVVAVFKRNPVNVLIILVAFGFAAYTRGYHSVTNMFYGTSDMYTHTVWVKSINNNLPFVGGVYPFGFHCTLSVLSTIYGFDVVTVLRMIAPIVGVSIVYSLYFVLKKTFKSQLAVNFAMVFYCVMNVFSPLAVERQSFALPQEYGMIFVLLCGYYLHLYMKEKRIHDLVCMSLSVSMTLAGHFYVTIYAVVICVAVFLANLVYLKRQVFFRLVIGVVCALLIAIVPLAAGVAKGLPLEKSLYWALGQLSGEDSSTTAQQEVWDDPEVLKESKTWRLTHPVLTLELYGFFDTGINNAACMEKEWFFIYLGAAGVGVLMPIVPFKHKRRRWDVAGMALYSLFALGVRLLPIFGFLQVMEPHRMLMFFIYAAPLAFAAPFELLYEIGHSFGKAAVVAYTVAASLIGGALGYYIYEGDRYGMLCRAVRQQYNGAVTVYYNITDAYDDNSWTIISPTDEYSLCLGRGYHHELSKFILEMEEQPDEEIIIPSRYVFFYVEKRPAPWSNNIFLGEPVPPLLEISEEDVYVSLSETLGDENGSELAAYKNYEAFRVLNAKAYAWAQEYMKYYPREMEVFYEDDDILVYKIEQNPYALSNLSIPYSGNQTKQGDYGS